MYHSQRVKRGHKGRVSRNRKHCKLKGKGPVRGFSKYQYLVWLGEKCFQTANAQQANEPAYRSISPFLPVCTVILLCDDASQHVVAIFRTINLLINVSHPQDVHACARVCCYRGRNWYHKHTAKMFCSGKIIQMISDCVLIFHDTCLPCVLWLYMCFTHQQSDLTNYTVPTLLGSFHTLLTSANSSCQN